MRRREKGRAAPRIRYVSQKKKRRKLKVDRLDCLASPFFPCTFLSSSAGLQVLVCGPLSSSAAQDDDLEALDDELEARQVVVQRFQVVVARLQVIVGGHLSSSSGLQVVV